MAALDCSHLILQQNTWAYSLHITSLINLLLIVLGLLRDLAEFTGYPGNKNECAHFSASDEAEFVAQPQRTPSCSYL